MKKIIILFICLAGILLAAGFLNSQQISYCCEKTTYGAWCQNTELEKCDSKYRTPLSTSCEATSYCKMGCCYDSKQGICMENTPQRVCEESRGTWAENPTCEIPQCTTGCCILGDQAAFVTQVRCKRLSALYGLETNYRTDVANEFECILMATSEEKGACVFEKDYEKTCKLTTQRECRAMMQQQAGENIEFFIGMLCSAETLGTNCGPTKETRCVDGKDGVYFIDSCGNLANIYDASKVNDRDYWTRIHKESESCNPTSSNANSATCGNCDYYLGSTCKSYQRGKDSSRPVHGNNICRDLSCNYDGKTYQHGETWCVGSLGAKDNLPGSRYFKLVCYNNEISVESCADFRQGYCIESEVGGFSTAGCVVNMWQMCVAQETKSDCEKESKGDCKWIDNSCSPIKTKEACEEKNNGECRWVKESKECAPKIFGCVPEYAPGLQFWGDEVKTDAQEICSQASFECVVVYEEGILSGKKCIQNCHCLEDNFKKKMQELCSSLGDCGNTTKNYLGLTR